MHDGTDMPREPFGTFLGRLFSHHRLWLVFLLLYLVGTLGTWLSERGTNPHFSTLLDSAWVTTVFILSGYDLGAPLTPAGRAFSVVLRFASMGIVGIIVAHMVDNLIRRRMVRMQKDISRHFVICNWNEKAEKIIRELHSPLAEPDRPIIVLCNPRPANEEELRSGSPPAFRNVELRQGDPVLHATLKSANAHKAQSVIILSRECDPDPDGASGLCALAVTTLWREEVEREVARRLHAAGGERENVRGEVESECAFHKPAIIVEAVDHKKMRHIRDAGADEIICTSDYGIGIIAQTAINAKISQVYHDLLTYKKGTNEIYMLDSPQACERFKGKTFVEIARLLTDHRDPGNPLIPLGIRHRGELVMNPKAPLVFESGDALIVLCYDQPDISAIAPGDGAPR